MKVRQVPGDGNCLFHSISACLDYVQNSNHSSVELDYLLPKSAALRELAVNYLVDDLNRILYLEEDETVRANELLEVVSSQYNMTTEDYCSNMRLPSVWGGGPEIVAISNCLKQPIHVYELVGKGTRFHFRRMACFGSPRYDKKCRPIHILSADARFPRLLPGQQLPNGNHFLALFPCDEGYCEKQKINWFTFFRVEIRKYLSRIMNSDKRKLDAVVETGSADDGHEKIVKDNI